MDGFKTFSIFCTEFFRHKTNWIRSENWSVFHNMHRVLKPGNEGLAGSVSNGALFAVLRQDADSASTYMLITFLNGTRAPMKSSSMPIIDCKKHKIAIFFVPRHICQHNVLLSVYIHIPRRG